MRIITIILCCFPAMINAQNLLPNPGFTDVNSCREYSIPCGPKGWFGVPIGAAYFEKSLSYDKSGSVKYLVYDFADKNLRSFLETEILVPLRKDSLYKVEMMVYGGCIDSGKLSLYLPSSDYLFDTKKFSVIKPVTGFHNEKQLLPSDKKYWYKLALFFRATGKEHFLVIGNFSTDEDFPACGSYDGAISYTLDNISLQPVYFTENMGSAQRRQDQLYERTERHVLLEEWVNAHRNDVVKAKPVTIDSFVIPDVFFDVDDASLKKGGELLLNNFIRKVDMNETDSIVVIGHTDNTGSIIRNAALSDARAAVIRNYLQGKTRIPVSSRGVGSGQPVASNDSETGREKNRRVAIYIYKKP